MCQVLPQSVFNPSSLLDSVNKELYAEKGFVKYLKLSNDLFIFYGFIEYRSCGSLADASATSHPLFTSY